MRTDTIPEAKEIGDILDAVSTKIPQLITGLLDTIYSGEAGKKMGQSVGNLYKELVESGIPEEDALQMAKNYMLTIRDLIESATTSANSTNRGKADVVVIDDRSN